MRRIDVILVVIALAFVAILAREFVLTQGRNVVQAPPPAPEPDAQPVTPNEVVVSGASLPPPERDPAAARARIRSRQHETYIGDILAARDSNIARWPARPDDPVRVWIDERPQLDAFDVTLPSQVRRAFADWGAAGVPLRFTFVSDSARAEVHVTFVDRFEQAMSGRTRWERTVHWWIVGGDIALSLRSGSGNVLTPEQVHAIALHEVGHLLGLDHARDANAVMAPRVSSLSLTPMDVATMRLIYDVPPGSLRDAR